MILTNKQEEAVKGAVYAYNHNERAFVISGYAGTGKSTTVSVIIEALGVDPKDVCYATFTGKAAQVLQRKGCANAKTLHKLLYESFPRPNGGFYHRPVRVLDYKVVVVDEVSMAPTELMKLLFSHKNVFVICLGDPFQLPPVSKDDNHHLLDKPNVFLDEVMRQAAESEIIRVSMDIRAGKPLQLMNGNEVKIFNSNEVNTGMMTWADQIIVGTNDRRKAINKQMRQMAGREGGPCEGDKVICLRNYWDTISMNGESLINGSIGYLKNNFDSFYSMPKWCTPGQLDIIHTDIELETGDLISNIDIDKQMVITGDKTLSKQAEFKLFKYDMDYLVPFEFEYGYAITCHKAQGSSWPKVLVIEERFPFDKETHARHLYTSITRAEKKCVIIRK